MIEIVRGSTEIKPVCKKQLENHFQGNQNLHGILYFGYPVVKEKTSLDALLITKEYGLVIFDLFEGDSSNYSDRHTIRDDLYNVIDSTLRKNKMLMDKREPFYQIKVFSYAPALNRMQIEKVDSDKNEVIVDLSTIDGMLKVWEHPEKYDILLSAIQIATKIRTNCSRTITHEESKGNMLRKIESSISLLDTEQNKAVIETSDGIQRIRGLAGSGKSIVLALKAAYLYALHPEFRIVITFITRSLKQLFRSFISRFVWEYTGEDYDESRLLILNAWGSFADPGLYSEICSKCGLTFFSYNEAREVAFQSGRNTLDVVYGEALKEIETREKELFDVILIDEAQDLPESFFELCQKVIKKKTGKLIIAYDELQNLKTGTSDDVKSFFKKKDIENKEGKPKRDIILPVCYRTSKEILVTAHAIGFGIYNTRLIQLFDNPELWDDVGYRVVSGALRYGESVVLERKEDASPTVFPPAGPDNVICMSFPTMEKEAEWISANIEKNLNEDDLAYKDILVIVLKNKDVDKYSGALRAKLMLKHIDSHIAGITTDSNVFQLDNSITISSVYRAKGNEAAIVYIMGISDVGELTSVYAEMRYRNNLFTSITRAKLWVRLSGVGEIPNITNEIKEIKRHNYQLSFRYPEEEEFNEMIKVYSEGKGNAFRQKKDLVSYIGEDAFKSLLEKYGDEKAIESLFSHLLMKNDDN